MKARSLPTNDHNKSNATTERPRDTATHTIPTEYQYVIWYDFIVNSIGLGDALRCATPFSCFETMPEYLPYISVRSIIGKHFVVEIRLVVDFVVRGWFYTIISGPRASKPTAITTVAIFVPDKCYPTKTKQARLPSTEFSHGTRFRSSIFYCFLLSIGTVRDRI